MRVRRLFVAPCATLLLAAAALAHEPSAAPDFAAWLTTYDQAFVSRDIERLAPFYHPDVTIYEGGSTNAGWADYRDNHLGPELKEMERLRFTHSDVTGHLLGADGRSAYVTAEYRLQARIGDRDVDAAGLETLIVVRDDSGVWQIRHSHTSSKRRPAPPAAAK